MYFSMKVCVCVIWNGMVEVFKKKYVKGVPSRGEGGGSATLLDWRPKYGFFFLDNEPSMIMVVVFGSSLWSNL